MMFLLVAFSKVRRPRIPHDDVERGVEQFVQVEGQGIALQYIAGL